MNIKRMMAGLMAGVLMMGSLSTTCFAAAVDSDSAEKKPEVLAENATTTSDAADAEKTEEEKLPYDVTIDEDGHYTFSFGDWEWSTEDMETDGTDAAVNNKVRSYLNLRSGSGTEYEIIGHLLPGEKVQVISEDGDWYQVVIPERTGYVYKDYVDMLKKEEESGTIDEEFLAMLLYLMMSSMNQTDNTLSLTPDGNLTLVDDIGSSTGAGQQFITMVTKSGNYFYLIIDHNDKGEENVHLLNMVDEADLFALMDEEQVKAFQTAQDAANAEEEEPAVTSPAPDEDAEPENQEPQVTEKKTVNMLPIVGVIAVLLACGGGYFMMQTKKKKASEQRPDPDADYTEDDNDEEYEIPMDDNDEDEIEYLDEDDDADFITGEEDNESI